MSSAAGNSSRFGPLAGPFWEIVFGRTQKRKRDAFKWNQPIRGDKILDENGLNSFRGHGLARYSITHSLFS